MTRNYVVQDGDCVASIAFEHGFHPDTIWEDPANETLRKERPHGYSLLPGDSLAIPDLRVRAEQAMTDKVHTYRRKGVPERLKLQLKDCGEPRAGVDYTLEIDGRTLEGTTDGDGRIEAWLSPDADQARLLVSGEQPLKLNLGFLKPAASDDGVRGRLRNLHFLAGNEDDAEALEAAIAAFQMQHGLEASGIPDPATRDKLLAEHKS